MATITYVLLAASRPIAVGDLATLKARAEEKVTSIVGPTSFRWDPAERASDDEPDNRLVLHRKVSISGRWIDVGCCIDEVPRLAPKRRKSG